MAARRIGHSHLTVRQLTQVAALLAAIVGAPFARAVPPAAVAASRPAGQAFLTPPAWMQPAPPSERTSPLAVRRHSRSTDTAQTAPLMSVGAVYGEFFHNSGYWNGTFDITKGAAPFYAAQFPTVDFDPPPGKLSCSNNPSVNNVTRPFTNVYPEPDGSCTTQPTNNVGVGNCTNQGSQDDINCTFEAVFISQLTVSQAGVTYLHAINDDGFVLSLGPDAQGHQPTQYDGTNQNAPPAGPFTGYQVVGAINKTNAVTTEFRWGVNFPAAGTYPMELDYTECCFGPGLSLMLGTDSNGTFQAIPSSCPTSPTGCASPDLGPGSPCVTCTHGNATKQPIDTNTGDFWHTFDDLSIPGRGIPLDLTHSYHSLLAGQYGPLGYGWTHSYNMYLTTDASSTIVAHEEEGTVVPFSYTSSGYQPPSWIFATLAQNGDGTYTFTRKNGHQYVFSAPTVSAAGRLLKEVDRNGYATSLNYSAGRLSSVTDPGCRTLTFAYNSSNLIGSVTDSGNRSVSFSYDGSGNLTDVIDVGGGHGHLTYDSNHLLLTMQSPRQYPSGPVTTNVYDSFGRAVQQTDPLNRVTTLSYTGNADGSQTTTITDPKGNVTKHVYQNNELLSVTRGYGTAQQATWTYSYDPVSRGVTQVIDPNTHTWMGTYDANGNLLTATDPLNHTWTYTYDGLNDLTSVKDATGATTTYTYDSKGNLQTASRPLTGTSQTATTTLTYGDTSHPGDTTAVTDPNNHTTSFQYDAVGNLTRVTDALGNAATYAYDALGRVSSEISPKGNVSGANPVSYTTSYTYDAFGDVLTVTDPLGNVTSSTYDANGNALTVTDPLNHTTGYTYDNDDELTQVTWPDTASTATGYDADGNVSSQTNGLNKSTTYAYDPLNRVTSTTDPLNRTTSYTYDAAGRLLTVIDPMNRTTTLGYDNGDQLTSLSYSDATTHSVSYSYTPNGQRATMVDGTGTSQYTYDSLYRLTQSQNGAGKTVQYGYDLGGNLTSLTYPDSTQVTRQYDAGNELTQVTDWLSHSTTFAYDPNGNLTSETFPASTNGAKVTAAYNNADQLTRLVAQHPTGAGAFRWVLGSGRDALGRVATASDRVAGARHSYSYDTLGRLTQDTRSNRSTGSWTYDAADELKTVGDTGTGLSTTLGYDNAGQLSSFVKTVTGTTTQNLSFSFNANGNRTQQTDSVTNTQTSFGYDQANRLTSWTSGGTNASYAYDGDGLRASKTVNGTGGAFVHDLAQGMPLVIGDGTTKYVTGAGGLPLEQVTSTGSVLYYVQDQLGSTRGLIDGSGNVAATFTYGPYGDLRGQTGTASNPFGYAGQYTDAESGLQYLRNRYYDPATEQFLTVDPLVAMTGEPYSYTAGSPLNGDDPLGLGCGFLHLGCALSGAGHALNGGASWVGGKVNTAARQVAIFTLNGGIDFIGRAGSDLRSGNPVDITLGVGYVYATVFLGLADLPGEGAVGLADDAFVVRGGACDADAFRNASGAVLESDGTISNVSVNSANGLSHEELWRSIPTRSGKPYGSYGYTTVGRVRAAGGSIVRAPRPGNPYHCLLSGSTPDQMCQLFTVVKKR